MKFLKQFSINSRNVKSQQIAYDQDQQIVFESTNAVLMPRGTTDQRPLNPKFGHTRYNLDNNELEIYIGSGPNDGSTTAGSWLPIGIREAAVITQQTFGPGNDTEYIIGPLNPIPVAAQNVLVFVENVFQLANTNYTLIQSPLVGPNIPYEPGWYLQFAAPIPVGKFVTVIHGYDQ
jgi:hypothetical protein